MPYCGVCGHTGSRQNPLTADHIRPRRHGGTNEQSNLTTRCRLHNSKKGTG